MKLLHTSDWHLGMLCNNQNIYEDQLHFINQICDIIREKNIDAVLIAGDIYDRSVASSDATDLYNNAMKCIVGELNIPVLIVAGNHDSAHRLATNSEILKKCSLYISGALTRNIECVTFDDTDIYLLPWITTDKVKTVFPECTDDISSLEDAYRIVCNKIKESFNPDKKHILVSHSFIVSAETSTSDKSAEVGLATAVSASVFDGFDYVALGHIHKPQYIGKNVCYSGTPMPYSFGKEEKQIKSVTIVDTIDMSTYQVPLQPLHIRKTISGTFEELCDGNFAEEIKNGYLRIEVTDIYIGLEALSRLRDIYPNVLEVAGKRYEDDNATITLSIEQLEKIENDPIELFKQFCIETLSVEPDEHKIEMFSIAVEENEKGADE